MSRRRARSRRRIRTITTVRVISPQALSTADQHALNIRCRPRIRIMTERKSYLLRMDRELLAAVQRWANDDLRSLNGQIEFLLRRALIAEGRAPKQASHSRGGSFGASAAVSPADNDDGRTPDHGGGSEP